jgi:hypothetical protein
VAFWLREYPPFAAATAELELNAQVVLPRAAEAPAEVSSAQRRDHAAESDCEEDDCEADEAALRAAAPAPPPDAVAVASARLQRRAAAQLRRAAPRAPRAAGATANTVGEFDILLTTRDATSAGLLIRHLELSVKFLLFASEADLALMAPPAPAPRVWWPGGPAGEFVGPHAFECFADRIERMRRQLALPALPPGRAFLLRRFGGGADAAGTDAAAAADDVAVAVRSEAYLKGFLFHPHAQWAQTTPLPAPDGDGGSVIPRAPCWQQPGAPSSQSSEGDDGFSMPGQEAHHDNADAALDGADSAHELADAAAVGGAHWCGWWSRDVAAVTSHPRHAASRWMPLHKRDWLSPAIIRYDDDVTADGMTCDHSIDSRLLDAAGLVAAVVAASEALRSELAAEAGEAGAPRTRRQRSWAESRRRQRRMLVAEMRRLRCGAWAEASRGFLVEPTWPAHVAGADDAS